ncbi:SMC family ATPase [Rossellomorea vietnamensis]|uniref:Nuclease SbcCD subunit C n=1 Tax=Rossellomorea vietnamensis TaxID=218284 RepID=A0A5D4KJG0_9BACI|nr:SMC family ATPase [Rossellomorea vietnamensis]TYR77382.1 SMC family ATPase [Rossellomorea vietnamensis]
MKPLQLTMQAFGPYPAAETIDFQLLENRTMFVISGKTGSGKTTIFDGISFAIYGKASGEDRNGNDLRSQFADDNDLTEVSLTFSLRGRTYLITRSPQQEKKKARGEGFTTVNAKAEFYSIDESGEKKLLAANVRDVDEKIKEIIQLDANQFRQILMIPQGEFRKLLTSDSKDKEAILQRLFHTEFYKNIQDKLKEESDLLKRDVEKAVEDRTRNLLGIHPEQNEALRELLLEEPLNDTLIIEKLQYHNTDMNKALSELNKLFDNKQKDRDQLQKQIVQAQKLVEQFEKRRVLREQKQTLVNKREDIERLKAEIKKAHQADKLLKQDEYCHRLNRELKSVEQELEKLHIQQRELTESMHTARENWEQEQKKEEKRKEAGKKVNSLESLREDVFSYGQLEDEVSNLDGQRKRLKDEMKQAVEGLSAKKKILQEQEERKAALENLRIEMFEIEKAISELQSSEKLLLHYQKIAKESTLLKLNLEKRNQQQKHAVQELEDARSTLNWLEGKWSKAQAGILASNLNEGDPCPVCGSEQHPVLAHLQDDLPHEKDIKAAKEMAAEKEKRSNESSRSYYEIEAQYTSIQTQKREVLSEITEMIEGIKEEHIDNELESVRRLMEAKKTDLKTGRQQLSGLQLLIENIEENKRFIEQQDKMIEQLTKDEQNLSENFYAKKGALESRRSAIPPELRTREKFTQALLAAEKELNLLQTSFEKAQEVYNRLSKDVSVNEAQANDRQAAVDRLKTEMEDERNKFLQILEEQGFESYRAFQEAKRTESEISSMEKVVSSYGEEVRSVKDRLEELEKALLDSEEPSLEELQQQFTLMNEELKSLNEDYNSMKMRKSENEGILEYVLQLNKKMKYMENRYSLAGHLAEMARGQNAHRLTFERYVLASFLEDILLVANERLMKMTSGRYRLIRKKDRSKGNVQSGLELLVFDQYTGQDRHVKTLSGGESFKAALCLALGLADVVQQYAGGVSLETMFIDEGFGTLDPESLDHAIEALMDIQSSGRLVGLISHVPELKERIDARLEVISSQTGSTTRFQFLA